MAIVHHPGYPLRDSLYWDETECLNYYGMLSLHEVFEIVGSQLTETDIEVLSFLLNETCSAPHPLDPAGWTVKPCEGEAVDSGVSPSPELLKVWRRLQPQGAQGSQGSQHPLEASYKPKSGLELLLELERRGYLSDGNLEPLLGLLRVLTRHDLLPLVSCKKRRTVSPERIGQRYGIEDGEFVCASGMRHSSRQAEMPLPSFTQQLRTGIYPPMPGPTPGRRRKKRGHGWSRRPKRTSRQVQPLPPPVPPHKTSCDIRLRVRAEYLEHESALRNGVSSDKQQPLERQFELFSQANSLLRARDLGSIVCDIKFTELDNLEAFWGDYLSGALLEALKGVFITDSLRMAAGTEGIRLLISVDQDDYEEGRRILRARRMLTSSNAAAPQPPGRHGNR
ncbi:death effector domain-containing 1 isoform X1 [Thunnus albacares]|uniref:death effector domain-containing 1 isoform X1 n=1 Tax=Thunnus maccoyii TaxID=8240 RepID=UPI001C4A952A|nr:death effector domain-containing 1 isoform X1 [Thunnus maccoyii]XP_042278951.1 death effector domain-containing 1 isoform X1 [Thunnus maccoyii]XP_044216125.1 death effector domain-containing 1 isoform X1 [Thunnus albacares]XP_044216127.1 death effector domain-containing 1 isoform X1 [Thunnus albacares]